MFTGLIKDVGIVSEIRGHHVSIKSALPETTLEIGASIACDGVCLSVISAENSIFSVQLSQETLDKTHLDKWQKGVRVNLEPSLRLDHRLDGHIVTGHVDTMARLDNISGDLGSYRLFFELPSEFLRFIAPKGSVCVDGVSLTVNQVSDKGFGVTIIEHTWHNTTFSGFEKGRHVNIEIDILARYLDRLLEKHHE